MASPLRDVSDTARWVAMYRAFESERPDALFRDPFARRLAGERGQEIVRAMPHGRSMAWALIVRTALIDELVLGCVARGARTVVNLGAGLDTRAFRLPLPSTLRWLDVDLPSIVAHRQGCLADAPAACRHDDVAVDLAEPAALAAVLGLAREEGGPVAVVAEGLLMYLTAARVETLARQLHGEPAMRWWLADLLTPLLLNTVGLLWEAQLAQAGAPFRFAPRSTAAFFEPLGWHEAEFRSIWSESIRLGRSPPLASWWDSIGSFALPGTHELLRRMSGVTLLERDPMAATSDISSTPPN